MDAGTVGCIVNWSETTVYLNKSYAIFYFIYKRIIYVIQDKAGLPWWLGLSVKGISLYDHNDRKTPRKVCELMKYCMQILQKILMKQSELYQWHISVAAVES